MADRVSRKAEMLRWLKAGLQGEQWSSGAVVGGRGGPFMTSGLGLEPLCDNVGIMIRLWFTHSTHQQGWSNSASTQSQIVTECLMVRRGGNDWMTHTCCVSWWKFSQLYSALWNYTNSDRGVLWRHVCVFTNTTACCNSRGILSFHTLKEHFHVFIMALWNNQSILTQYLKT